MGHSVRKFNWKRYCLALCDEFFDHFPPFDETLRHICRTWQQRYQSNTAKSANTSSAHSYTTSRRISSLLVGVWTSIMYGGPGPYITHVTQCSHRWYKDFITGSAKKWGPDVTRIFLYCTVYSPLKFLYSPAASSPQFTLYRMQILALEPTVI